MKNLRKRTEGFTIIEVMIVLVIAAIILLIVFLAVPALQRNSRNTQRKNDVAGVLAGINEYMANNNGAFPAILCNNATNTTITVVGGSCAAPTNAVSVNVSGQFSAAPSVTAWSAAVSTSVVNQLRIYTGAVCGGTGNNDVVQGSGRSIAVNYQIESNITQCSSS